MPEIRRILVPVDFSTCSRAALDYAAFLAACVKASVDILHVVWEPPSYVGAEVLVDIAGETRQSLASYSRTQAERELASFLADWKPPEGVSHRTLLEFGEPVTTILEVAGEQGYDLIVVGTHGRKGLSHLLMGSVAERVVRRASCPVLSVRVPEAHGVKARAG